MSRYEAGVVSIAHAFLEDALAKILPEPEAGRDKTVIAAIGLGETADDSPGDQSTVRDYGKHHPGRDNLTQFLPPLANPPRGWLVERAPLQGRYASYFPDRCRLACYNTASQPADKTLKTSESCEIVSTDEGFLSLEYHRQCHRDTVTPEQKFPACQ